MIIDSDFISNTAGLMDTSYNTAKGAVFHLEYTEFEVQDADLADDNYTLFSGNNLSGDGYSNAGSVVFAEFPGDITSTGAVYEGVTDGSNAFDIYPESDMSFNFLSTGDTFRNNLGGFYKFNTYSTGCHGTITIIDGVFQDSSAEQAVIVYARDFNTLTLNVITSSFSNIEHLAASYDNGGGLFYIFLYYEEKTVNVLLDRLEVNNVSAPDKHGAVLYYENDAWLYG